MVLKDGIRQIVVVSLAGLALVAVAMRTISMVALTAIRQASAMRTLYPFRPAEFPDFLVAKPVVYYLMNFDQHFVCSILMHKRRTIARGAIANRSLLRWQNKNGLVQDERR